MSISTTEGKTFIGIVVGGDDNTPDPYGMGRVKVLCPSLHHPDININELPWCFMASQPDNVGGFSYNRPPPLGSIVEVFYSPGTKSTGQGMIRSVINGVHNPYGLMAHTPGKALAKSGYYSMARIATPSMHSGPAIRTQSDGDAVSGNISYRPYPPMLLRDHMDSSLANKAWIRRFYKFKSVSCATQFAACVFDAAPSNPSETPKPSYPCHDIAMEDWIHYVTSHMLDDHLRTGARNYGDYTMTTQKTSETTLNYAYSGNKTYDIAWRLQTLNLFSTTVIDQVSLNNALHIAESEEWLKMCQSACTTAIPTMYMEPQWETLIKQDEAQCSPPDPGGDSVETQVLEKPIKRTIMLDGELKVDFEEEAADEEFEKKLKKIPYAGGTGWFVSSHMACVMLRVQKSAQGSAPIIKSRNKYPQRLINNTYKNYKGGSIIDRGTCEEDKEE